MKSIPKFGHAVKHELDITQPITILCSIHNYVADPPPIAHADVSIAFLLGDVPHWLQIVDVYYDIAIRLDPSLRLVDSKLKDKLISKVRSLASIFDAERKARGGSL